MSDHKKNMEHLVSEVQKLRRQLSEAEKLYKSLAQTNLYGIQEMDVYGNITYTNSVLCEILGYSGGELKGKPIWQLLAFDSDREGLRGYLTKLAQGEAEPEFWLGKYTKKIRKRKTREVIELQQNWSYVQNKRGRITRFISLTTDIVDYKQAQRGGPKGEEERYRLIVESVREMILTFDIHQRITYVNTKATEALGYFEEEFLAMSIEDVLPIKYLKKMEKELLAGHAAGSTEIVIHNAEFVDRNLKALPVRISASLILKDHEPSDILLIARHVGQINENPSPCSEPLQKSMTKTNDIYRLIAENVGEMVLTFDMEGRITYVNQGWEELSGYFEEELLDMNIADLLPPEHLERLKKKLLDNPELGSRGVVMSNAEFINRGLKLVPIEINSSLIMRDGLPSDILIIARDLERQRKIEKERLEVEKFESLSTFADGFADDLNTLLTGVMGNIELAQMGVNAGGKTHKILSYARKSCMNIKDLARQFVIFSKSGPLIKKIGTIENLVKNSSNAAITDANVGCKFFISDKLWPVDYDENQMRQVIHNLLVNARESMHAGGQIKVYVENVTVSEDQKDTGFAMTPGDYVKISVQDQGIGIPEEYLGKIFDPYFSTKKKGEKEHKGRGLGLTLVYSVVRKHHGYIDVDSKPGTRTTFSIYIPAVKKERLKRKEKKHAPVVSKGRILIMDDEELATDVAGQALNELGYEVVVLENGNDIVNAYANAMNAGNPFDVVILDLHVKTNMGAKGTMKELMKTDPYVRVVASSTCSDDPVMTDFDKYGFSGIVEKPYRINDLSITLYEIMEEYETIEVSKSDWISE